jgi:hypothetical protein
LLLQSQVVFDVPILSDPSIGDAVNVGGDEIDRLSFALDLPEAACEVTVEAQVRDDTILGHDHLLNLAADIWDREAYQLRCCQWSGNALGSPGRQDLKAPFSGYVLESLAIIKDRVGCHVSDDLRF